jgi:hypothetical protein
MEQKFLPILFCFVLAAGCMSPSQPQGTTQPTMTGTSTEPTHEPISYPVNKTGEPSDIFFSDCRDAVTWALWPGNLGPEHRPPGWEPVETTVVTGIWAHMIECDRVSWGPIERPLHLLFEMHDNFAAAENCTSPEGMSGPGIFLMLNSLLVDSQAAADYLKATYDLPTAYASFNVTSIRQADAYGETWTWSLPGQPASEVSFYDVHRMTVHSLSSERPFWFNKTSLSYFNLNFVVTETAQAPLGSTPGTMHPPMLYATTTKQTNYLGDGQSQVVEIEGHIKRYADFECREPLV